MPPLPVRDLLVHPREQDLVVGTYGRGVWVTNVSPLRELSPELLEKDFHLFNIVSKPADNKSQRARWGNYQMTGDAHIRTPNEQPGLQIFYFLKDKQPQPLTITVADQDGTQITKVKTKTDAGIHKIIWNHPKKAPGTYRFTLTDGAMSIMKKGILKPRILWPVGNPDQFRQQP